MTELAKDIKDVVKELGLSIRLHDYPRDCFVDCPSDRLLEVVKKLKDEFNVHHVSTIIVRDGNDGYHCLYPLSIPLESGEWSKLILDVTIDKNKPEIDSITPILPGAIIAEREVYDMMGITIKNHPDHRRLLTPDIMPEDIFPLRKDITYQEIRDRLAEEAEKVKGDIE